MEPIVAFFEKLVSEFSWRRVGLLVAVLVTALIGMWGFEVYTGHFRAGRSQLAVEQLVRLSDPDLKKNVQGDEELETAHRQLKKDLNKFIQGSQFDLGIPEPLLKALAAAVPWFFLGVLIVSVAEKGHSKGVFAGMAVVAAPFVIVGALLPSSSEWWLNYIVYPFGSVVLVSACIVLWQRSKKPRPESSE